MTRARERDKFPDDRKSAPVTLVAGRKCDVRAPYREGTSGDGLAVVWGGPGIGAGPVVIDGVLVTVDEAHRFDSR